MPAAVGTTVAMLDEANRRRQRGTDVVVAAVKTDGRNRCEVALGDLEMLGGPNSPARDRDMSTSKRCCGATRRSRASTTSQAWTRRGGRSPSSVPRLLRAGMMLIATLHLTDLRSTVDGMGAMLGPRPEHVVDDAFLDQVTELEIVDITPSLLDERLRRGEIVPASEAAQARARAFRPEVLASLRELAFRILAEHTDRRLVAYMRDRGIETPWEVKPRVMLCVPPRPGMEDVIASTAALAARLDGKMTAVTVRDRKRSEQEMQLLGAYAALTHQADGTFVTLYESDPASGADALRAEDPRHRDRRHARARAARDAAQADRAAHRRRRPRAPDPARGNSRLRLDAARRVQVTPTGRECSA